MRFGEISKKDRSGRRTKRTTRRCDGARNEYKTFINPENKDVMYRRWSSKGRLDGHYTRDNTFKQSKKKVIYQNIKDTIEYDYPDTSQYDCTVMKKEEILSHMWDIGTQCEEENNFSCLFKQKTKSEQKAVDELLHNLIYHVGVPEEALLVTQRGVIEGLW